MLKQVWTVNGSVRKRATFRSQVNGYDIYSLDSEPGDHEFSLCVEINGALLRCATNNDTQRLVKLLTNVNFEDYLLNHVVSSLPAYEQGKGYINLQAANAIGLKEEALEARSKREALKDREAEEKVAQEAAKEAKRKEELAKELLVAEESLLAGKEINSQQYEQLLTKYNLWDNIPIKTRGWIRKQLVSVHKEGYKSYSKSSSVFDITRLLVKTIGENK